ncbi:MAG: hypothetical protein U1E76_17610 [Planctomycetota bacterium]
MQGHFFQPALLGLTHLAVLGWLLPITLGALHQLVPVVFEAPIRSERAAWIALTSYVVGATGLIGHMWIFSTHLGLVMSAVLLAGAILIDVGNLLVTISRARTVGLTGWCVIASLFYLLVAAPLGLLLAWNLHRMFLYVDHLQPLRAHAHLASLGFFAMLIMGVSLKLIEMFMLSHGVSERPAWVALLAFNLGLLVLTAHFLFGAAPLLFAAGVALLALAIALYLWQVARLYRHRLRRRTEVAWWHTLMGLCYLALALSIGITLGFDLVPAGWRASLTLLYGLFALPGFVGGVIVGQMYKIVPFLVWFHRFSKHAGLRAIPTASELLGQDIQRVQWLLMHVGFLTCAGGVLAHRAPLLSIGALFLLAGAALFGYGMIAIYRRQP